MAWYDTGTVAVTNGSTTVTGTGTDFISGAQVGEAFLAPDDKLYEIQSITSATVLVLADPYLGSTQSGQDYKIVPTQSLVADLASQVTDLITDYSDVKDTAGAGKFNDGTVTAPAITFEQDQNNGLYRIGNDNYAMSAGGVKQIDISTTDVELNYSGSKKLATTATGVDVTGTVTADGLTVDGDADIVDTTASNTNTLLTLRDNRTTTSEENYVVSVNRQNSTTPALYLGNNDTNEAIIAGNNTSTYIGKDVTGTFRKTVKFGGNGDVSFYEDTGTTPKMTWDASAESLAIGTTADTGRVFHVKQNGNYPCARFEGKNGGYSAIEFSSHDNDATVGALSAWSGTVRIGHREASEIGVDTSKAIIIDSSGNVGIGTANVYGNLHLQGGQQDLILTNEDADGVAGATIGRFISQARGYGNDGAEMASIDFETNASSWFKGDIVFKTNSSDGTNPTVDAAERMRLDSSGNLLVGTTSTKGEGVTSKKGFGIRSTQSNTGGIQQYCRTYTGSTTYQTIITKAGSVQGFAEVTVYTAYGTPSFSGGILRLLVLPNGTVSVLSEEGATGSEGTGGIQYQWSGDNFQVKTSNSSIYFTCHIKLIDTLNQWPQQS